MSEKLKPCPFCGKKASIQDCSYFGSTPMWSAMCDNPKCFAYTEAFKTKKEAVERWNNRPAEEALQKQIAELEKEKSELLAKCEKYECEIGLSKQRIALLESRNNMYTDLTVAMASTVRKVDGLEKERDRLRKALRGLMQAVDGCLTPSEALLWKKCEEAMKGSEIGQRGGKTH